MAITSNEQNIAIGEEEGGATGRKENYTSINNEHCFRVGSRAPGTGPVAGKSQRKQRNPLQNPKPTVVSSILLRGGAGGPIGRSYRLAINQLDPWCECSDQ